MSQCTFKAKYENYEDIVGLLRVIKFINTTKTIQFILFKCTITSK